MLGTSGQAFLLGYLASLLLIGWLGRRARRDNSLEDFYLAGRGLGLPTLFFSLYATQYSGNALVGYPANAYRQGFSFFSAITFMLGIVGVYWLFAPRLQRLATLRRYLTPGDLIRDRYDHAGLLTLLNTVFVVVLASYILANLKAVGQVLYAVTDGNVSLAAAIWLAALIMVIYESLGGMRSVAWTDAIQGLLLLLGCLTFFAAINLHYDGVPRLLELLREQRPEFWEAPDASRLAGYASIILVVAFGAAVYPQALQRIFSAKNPAILRRSLQLMLLMPLLTITLVLAIGLTGAAVLPGLDRAASEGITLALLSELIEAVPSLRWLFVLFLAAALAAIMSTVDSALLALSSLFTQDFYRRWRPATPEAKLTFAGKLFSWLVMAAMATLAIHLPQTIWQLTVVKLEVLCQAAPAIIGAVQPRPPQGGAVLRGLATGLAVVLALRVLAGFGWLASDSPLGVESGAWGLIANVAVVWFAGRGRQVTTHRAG
ncbi:MAG: sodium:solute symporter family protein [Pseudomonadota bacterium]